MADDDAPTPQKQRAPGTGYTPSALEKSRDQGQPSKASAAVQSEQLAFALMEDILDKLKLLDYEQKFCQVYTKNALRPLFQTYFAIQSKTAAAEQFFYFTQLFAWLVGLCGRKFIAPQRTDDPNATSSSIVAELKSMGFTNEVPITRVRQGYGEVVCQVLNQLLNVALSTSGFQFLSPIHEHQEQPEEEVQGDLVEEVDADTEEVVEEKLNLDENETGDAENNIPETAPLVDTQQWQIEVERVAPQLKVHVVADSRDWRARRDQLNKHRTSMTSQVPEFKPQLERITEEIGKQLQQIENHEKYLNEQMTQMVAEYSASSKVYSEMEAKYKEGCKIRDELLVEIKDVETEISGVSEEVEMYKASLRDNKPVLELKAALKKIKDEIQQMDIRIGVVENALLTGKMHERHLHPTSLTAVEEGEVEFGEAVISAITGDAPDDEENFADEDE